VEFHQGYAATVVAASKGYPDAYEKGKQINIKKKEEGTIIFHAGTSKKSSTAPLLTSGGRVLAVTGTSHSLQDAVNKAYSALKHIEFDGMFYRNDIAHRYFPRCLSVWSSKHKQKPKHGTKKGLFPVQASQ